MSETSSRSICGAFNAHMFSLDSIGLQAIWVNILEWDSQCPVMSWALPAAFMPSAITEPSCCIQQLLSSTVVPWAQHLQFGLLMLAVISQPSNHLLHVTSMSLSGLQVLSIDWLQDEHSFRLWHSTFSGHQCLHKAMLPEASWCMELSEQRKVWQMCCCFLAITCVTA